ncbi:ABC transporter ATP-binding protein [Rudaeicoccus suwonensis]|uniref:ABC-type quaternary amine transporter n=1 Tax=Rudaeicoccus suwonensis TaxID=657409 RepID=A0A561E386_9MICO|nr:ABC transporter ATP-binding protein [Rudaeicoccus suwonensis]TWE10076.1 iron(III) transport system ATP-binding protein [Rudaeicoccus suwonensis]
MTEHHVPTTPPAAPAAIELRGVNKSFGATAVIHGVDLKIESGSVTAILGASGSGKTTLLRLIAGFESPDSGTITLGAQVVTGAGRSMRPQHRGVGYVPQDAALFPHLTVAGNVAFGMSGSRSERRTHTVELLDRVGLGGLERRYPHQLSGGQQQRVALARALAIQPRIVLLDEPFGSLDSGLRESVRAEVRGILTATGVTSILVTHDQAEALSFADHVAMLANGVVVAHDSPQELYHHPPTAQVARLLGAANLLPTTRTERGLRCIFGEYDAAGPTDERRLVLLRPEQLELTDDLAPAAVTARVQRVRFQGGVSLVDVRTSGSDGIDLLVQTTGSPPETGSTVGVKACGIPHICRG